ncbi:MAG: GH36-type glycosyl hydrolase domain-containing protein, partial [Planctomycetota bacterium]
CDTMNGVGQAGQGESVMLSMQVKWGCDQLAELAERLGRQQVAREMRSGAKQLTDAIQQTSWDGRWFIRAFDDDGVPIGSTKQPEDQGRIFLNPQSWAVIAGLANDEQIESALAAATENLDTGYGMVLHGPAFTELVPRIGQMTAMTPGFYENGSVYVHGNCFWIHALAMAGRGEASWQAIRAILPDTDNKPNTDTEPFVIPNYYIGPVVERRKQRNLYLSGWRTGSAAWLYVTAMEWILGVRAEYDGLEIDPHLPDGWDEVRIGRDFRGDRYEITIRRKTAGPGGRVESILFDGQAIEGTTIRPIGDGGTHEVAVTMG